MNSRRGRLFRFLGWLTVTDHDWIAPALAANPSTPEDLLLRLAAGHHERTELALVKARRYLPMSRQLAGVLSDSPDLPPELIRELWRQTMLTGA